MIFFGLSYGSLVGLQDEERQAGYIPSLDAQVVLGLTANCPNSRCALTLGSSLLTGETRG